MSVLSSWPSGTQKVSFMVLVFQVILTALHHSEMCWVRLRVSPHEAATIASEGRMTTGYYLTIRGTIIFLSAIVSRSFVAMFGATFVDR